jgi:rhamnosyl/mannosyltransferase
MIRIAHIYKTYFPDTVGGCEQVIKSIAEVTSSLGCENKLITTTKGRSMVVETVDRMQVHRYPQTFNLASCPVSIGLWRAFKTQIADADILHYHFPWPYADAVHLLSKTKKPIVVTYHSDIVRQKVLKKLYMPVMHCFLKRTNCIVSTSENLLASSIDLALHRDRCSSIPIGIDDKDYFPVDLNRVQYYQQKFGNNFMLFIGVMRYYKGLHYLLNAIANTNIVLVIAGSGPMEQQLKRQAEQLKLNNVHFIGRISEKDKSALLHLCRAVVVPSHVRAEAFGVTLLEGLIFGKPIICTELLTGTSYVNENGVTGFVVKPGDSISLRQAMQALHADDELAKRMGIAARKRYETYFTAEKMGTAYYELYKTLI